MYNVRDLLGHFVRLPPAKNRDGMCPHPCCRGRRPHPDRLPVMLSRSTLRSLSVDELEAHYQRESVGRNGRAVSQVVRELDRRERDSERKAQRAAARSATRDEHRAYLESQWIAAEHATRGVMVNRRGQRAGVDPRTFWTDKRARDRYASDELRGYFDRHPPVSAREFAGGHQAHASGARRRQGERLYGVY